MVNSCLNYTGSKHKLLPQLLPLFDYSKPYFADVFTGGGVVALNVADKYQEIWMNDIIGDLIGIHRSLLENPGFVAEVKSLCVTKADQAGYVSLRASYNAAPTPAKLFALILCCTNNMIRFNQSFKFNQTFGKRTFSDATQKKIDAYVSHLKPHAAKIHYSSLDFEEVKPLHISQTMFYVDSPYAPKAQGNGAGYNAFWNESHEKRLVSYLAYLHEHGASIAVSNVWSPERNINALSVNALLDLGFKVTHPRLKS